LGLERTPTAAARGYDEPPLVTDTPLEELGGSWGAVVFWHSLEHLAAPTAALRKTAELLVAGGLLIVSMPNAASLQARLFADEWLALDLPRHLTHVPPRALLAALEDTGFRVERVSFWRGGQVMIGWLHGLVGSLPGQPSLYDALRRPEARCRRMSKLSTVGVLLAGATLTPVAAALAAVEIMMRRSGTVYVEARRV
jgi:hypothetical protein